MSRKAYPPLYLKLLYVLKSVFEAARCETAGQFQSHFRPGLKKDLPGAEKSMIP